VSFTGSNLPIHYETTVLYNPLADSSVSPMRNISSLIVAALKLSCLLRICRVQNDS
jgi:hypothetical protein